MKLKFNHICRGLLFSGLILTNISCSDSFLELNNPNQVSDNTFWQSENDALMGLAACYDALQSDHLYDDNVDGGGFGFLMTRVRDNILKSKEQKNIQPTKGGHKMVTCQNYVSLFYRQITSCPSDGGIS